MGYYLNENKAGEPLGVSNKRKGLENDEGFVNLKYKPNWEDIPEDKALICEVLNASMGFSAAGVCFSERELEAFTSPTDHRPKRWFLVDKEWAFEVSGYSHAIK